MTPTKSLFCQNSPILRVFGLLVDQLREDEYSKSLPSPRAGAEGTGKLISFDVIYI
jgi:hypothetical protein